MNKLLIHKALTIIILNVLFLTAYSQVYNYIPISRNEIETNPASLSTQEINNRIQIIHQNAFFSSNQFMLNSIRLTKYINKSFAGIGLTLNNTKYDNDTYYNHIGIGVGYRNMLFNKIAIRIGGMYKLSMLKAQAGSYDYLSFISNEKIVHSNINNSVNMSLSVSYGIDKFHFTAGYLNLFIPIGNKYSEFVFPKYYYINMGNFFKIFRRRGSKDLSYTLLIQENKGLNIKSLNHFINYKHSTINLSRKSSLYLGLKVGLLDNSYLQFAPSLTYFEKKMAISVSYNFHNDKETFKSVYFPSSQINIVYIL